MYYEIQPKKQKEQYKDMLNIMGQLSRLFSEAKEPYLHYRVHENIFSKYFNVINNARSDDSADAYDLNNKIGIGLKTWIGKNDQKVAEFGKLRKTYSDLDDIEMVKKIAEYRNTRIRVTMKMRDLNNMLYHVVKRLPGLMQIYESKFEYIDIENIIVDNKRGNDNNIYFSDGINTYHFSKSKNTLYMIFDDMELLDEFSVNIFEDPYELLSSIIKKSEEEKKLDEKNKIDNIIKNVTDTKQKLCLRLYSTKSNGEKYIPEKSGLNQWNGARTNYKTDEDGNKVLYKTTPRNKNEIYIPYPAEDRKRGEFFPPRDTPFDLMLPNGKWIKAKVCQADGKAIMSNPNELLGKWLLRDVLEIEEGKKITYEMLKVFGIDSVIFTKLGKEKYSIDFCELGTYEKFYKIEED